MEERKQVRYAALFALFQPVLSWQLTSVQVFEFGFDHTSFVFKPTRRSLPIVYPVVKASKSFKITDGKVFSQMRTKHISSHFKHPTTLCLWRMKDTMFTHEVVGIRNSGCRGYRSIHSSVWILVLMGWIIGFIYIDRKKGDALNPIQPVIQRKYVFCFFSFWLLPWFYSAFGFKCRKYRAKFTILGHYNMLQRPCNVTQISCNKSCTYHANDGD